MSYCDRMPEETRETQLEEVDDRALPAADYATLLHEMRVRGAQWEREQRRCQREIDRLRSRIQEFESSTSWRVTRPLRWLGRILRRR